MTYVFGVNKRNFQLSDSFTSSRFFCWVSALGRKYSAGHSFHVVSFYVCIQVAREKNMKVQRLLGGLAITAVISLLAMGGSSAHAEVTATNVPAGIQFSKDLGLA